MYTLFNLLPAVQKGTLRSPEWNYIRSGLRANIGAVQRYYRQNPASVKSDHFLIRLLYSLGVPMLQSLERYYYHVDAVALNMSMPLKMTSSISSGATFEGVFYGAGVSEILIAHNESFDFNQANRDWKNLQAVKVLRHPRSDVYPNLPNGSNSGVETGLAVIAINIPMLAVQYRAFRLNEIAVREGTNDNQLSVGHFIHMYVLPNMVPSHLDYALFNRIDKLSRGFPLGENTKKFPFVLNELTKKIDGYYRDVLLNLQRNSQDFTGTLRTIPAATLDSMNEVMDLPDVTMTRQVMWGAAIARMPAVNFLFDTAVGGAKRRNGQEVNAVLRAIRSYKANHLMRNVLPFDLYQDVQDDINEITRKATSPSQ